MCKGYARHLGHDAGGHKAEQGPYNPAAPERGVAVLEGQHPVEGSGPSDPDREHDPALCEGEGRLVDQHGALQPRANQTRSDRRQDGLQEESRAADATLPEVGTRTAA